MPVRGVFQHTVWSLPLAICARSACSLTSLLSRLLCRGAGAVWARGLWSRLNGAPGGGQDSLSRGTPLGLPLPGSTEEARRQAIQQLNVQLDGLEKELQVGGPEAWGSWSAGMVVSNWELLVKTKEAAAVCACSSMLIPLLAAARRCTTAGGQQGAGEPAAQGGAAGPRPHGQRAAGHGQRHRGALQGAGGEQRAMSCKQGAAGCV